MTPIGERIERDLFKALAAAGAEVRLLQDFWPLRDEVVNSSLEFSIIHADRAKPRRSEDARAHLEQGLAEPNGAGPESDSEQRDERQTRDGA